MNNETFSTKSKFCNFWFTFIILSRKRRHLFQLVYKINDININVQNHNFQFPKYNLVFFFYSTEDLWSRRKDRVWLSFFPDWNSRPDCGRDGFHQSDWGRTMNFLGQVANIWSGKILSAFVHICKNWLRIYWIII